MQMIQYPILLLFSGVLLTLAYIDYRHQQLPDILTLPLLALGLLCNAFGLFVSPMDAVLGAGVGYVFFAGLGWLYQRWRGVMGLGLGDAKLLAALGAWLGVMKLPAILLISSVLALLVHGWIMLCKNQKPGRIAFGPYLAVAGWVLMLLLIKI